MDNENCIFCKIANGIIPSNTIYEDDLFRAILDISPATKGHILILPKKHFTDISKMDNNISGKIFPIASKLGLACEKALSAGGFNILVNKGESAGQTIFHTHVHVIPRYTGAKKILVWDELKFTSDELLDICDKIKGNI